MTVHHMGESAEGTNVGCFPAQVALVASSPTSHAVGLRCPRCGDRLTAGVQSRRTVTGYTNTAIWMCFARASHEYVVRQDAPRQLGLVLL